MKYRAHQETLNEEGTEDEDGGFEVGHQIFPSSSKNTNEE